MCLRSAALAAAMFVALPAAAEAPTESRRPAARPVEARAHPAETPDFADWLAAFGARAVAGGVPEALVARAFRGVRYDAEVVRRDRNQNEFTKTIWEYLNTAVSDARVVNGKAALQRNQALIRQIESKYGVDGRILVAIWGLESAYGGFRGTDSTIQSLATLAFDARRRGFFEDQLMEALRILHAGHVTPERMRGSWAGAMGHMQFMPTSFRDHAVDWTGDGKRDIWGDDPADALASAAAYLKANGWTKGQPWGVEVRLPKGFDYKLANRAILKRPGDWAALGVTGWDGAPVADHGMASVLLPAGAEGAAFMIFDNFEVLESYNTADAYVIGVGHLGDRIMGGPPIRGGWPRQDRALTYAERIELQERLTARGFDTEKIDGRIGPLTINAVRAFQVARGLVPDGYASPRLLGRLRR